MKYSHPFLLLFFPSPPWLFRRFLYIIIKKYILHIDKYQSVFYTYIDQYEYEVRT